jgi:hypothetical protein
VPDGGVMIATQANPGQGTLRIAAEKAQAMSVIIIQNRNKLDRAERFDAAMAADGLFKSEPAP